jgi:hypothetical protein
VISQELLDRSQEEGRKGAAQVIEASKSRSMLETAKPFAGYLILEGDSWFDYPLYEDIAEALKDEHNYKIRSAAKHGDTAIGMAYEGGQRRAVHDLFKDLADDGKKARAIVLSCAGNDVVDVLAALLNHSQAGLGGPINASVVQGVLREQVPAAIGHLIGALIEYSNEYFGETRPIIIHGYGNPVPDGRGYPFLGLSGPWLKPVFGKRGYVSVEPQPPSELQANADVMRELMRVFNEEVLPAIAVGSLGKVTYVDVRKALSSVIPGRKYQESWNDEMHASKMGFKAVAALIDATIQTVAPTVP